MVKTRNLGGVFVLGLGGMVNVTNTRSIFSQIKHLVEDPTIRKIVLDMSGVLGVDSSGLGLLVRIAKTVQAHGAELLLAGPSRSVMDAMHLTKLDRFFTTAEDVDSAVALLEKNANPKTEDSRHDTFHDELSLTDNFRNLLRSVSPTVSDEEIGQLMSSVQRLENWEMMMGLLVDAYDKDLLAKADEIATKRLSVIREVAIGLNHEINNPLTVILATSELLERKLNGSVESNVIQRLRSIQSQCERIKEIVAKVSAIVKPVSSEYYCGMKMIDLHRSA
ncbi:MAG: anti-sigma factor antagonist [Candidatus Coatesbacteria bacterium]|nr:anti-sigma factor antagonist [Candidatus Coatesbacteria bacterium]